MNKMKLSPAAAITKAGSKQSYYTIRFLVDRDRVEDAFRAYGYFRWVDDILDAAPASGIVHSEAEACMRKEFLERQKSLLESCYRDEPPGNVNSQEQMLVELVQRDHDKNSGLRAYLSNMMKVMDFDVARRGRLVSQSELNSYTLWLSIAVTEALDYFIGHGEYSPHDETRYRAVSAAHIVHMLRDTYADLQFGYFNIPREVLVANHLEPGDTNSLAYRAWVKSRIELAREDFQAGRFYFQRVQNPRHRLAGLAYMARFEWLLESIEREGFVLRPEYLERKSFGTGLHMSWTALSSMLLWRGTGMLSGQIDRQQE